MDRTGLTMADPSHILGVSGVPKCPMLHLDLLSLLCFPDGIHQDVDGTLVWHVGIAIQDWHSQHDAKAILTGSLEFFQDRVFAVEFSLSIEIGRTSGGICLIRRIARFAGEHIFAADQRYCSQWQDSDSEALMPLRHVSITPYGPEPGGGVVEAYSLWICRLRKCHALHKAWQDHGSRRR
jgi:hypothetical protein